MASAALQQAQRSLNFANMVALMVDAQHCHQAGGGLGKRELALANRIVKEGRAIVIVLNKLDLLTEAQQQQVITPLSALLYPHIAALWLRVQSAGNDFANVALSLQCCLSLQFILLWVHAVQYEDEMCLFQVVKAVGEGIEESLPDVPGAPCIAMSALTGKGAEALMPTVLQAFEVWNLRVPTARLNRWLIKAMLADTDLPAENLVSLHLIGYYATFMAQVNKILFF